MNKERIIGIDLGTTNSGCGIFDYNLNRVVIAENREGEKITPSVVQILKNGSVIVGSDAKREVILSPEEIAMLFKKDMGKVKEFIHVHGTSYSPQELSAFVLKSLIRDAEEELDIKVVGLVVTVPAYYDANSRKAVEEAVALVSKDLKLHELLNEPTAVILNADLDFNIEKTHVLVDDIGGGTTDITVAEVSKDAITEKIIAGDVRLGGSDFDKAFLNYIRSTYLKGYSLDLASEQELQEKVEMAKIKLSQKDSEEFAILVGEEFVRIKVTRKEFEDCTKDLLKKHGDILKGVKNQMAAKGIEVDKIILAGGSSKMPQIIDQVKSYFPNIEIIQNDVNLAVIKGAAIRAAYYENKKDDGASGTAKKEDVTFKDLKTVSSRTYGVAAFYGDDLKIFNMIFQNDSLPSKMEEVYRTRVENQREVAIDIYESTSSSKREEIENGNLLGKCILKINGDLPKSSPIYIELHLMEDGTLHVRGREKSGNTEVTAVMKTAALFTEQELGIKKEEMDECLLV